MKKILLFLVYILALTTTVFAENEANSLAELYAYEEGVNVLVKCPLTVTYFNSVDKRYTYVTDGTTAGLIYVTTTPTYKQGDIIPGGEWAAKWSNYSNGLIELIPSTPAQMPEPSGTATVTPTVIAASDVTVANQNRYVTVKNVVLDAATPNVSVANFTGKVGDVTLNFRNTYKLAGVAAGTYHITGVISVYNGNPQFIPTAFEVVLGEGNGAEDEGGENGGNSDSGYEGLVVGFKASLLEYEGNEDMVNLTNNDGSDTCSDNKDETKSLVGKEFENGDIKLNFGHGTGQYYSGAYGAEVRIFAGETMTFTAVNGATITKIFFQPAANSKGAPTPDQGEMEGGGTGVNDPCIWTGEVVGRDLVFTAEKQFRLRYVIVTYASSDTITHTCATPVIYPVGGQIISGSQEIIITCATAGAEIHYTLDGTEPTEESTLYSEPFTLTATATVKAIAFKNGYASEIASAEYVINDSSQRFFIIGEANGNSWAPNVGVEMEDDDEDDPGLYFSATVTFNGENSGYSYFSFTEKLGVNASDWNGITSSRWGATANNFDLTSYIDEDDATIQKGENSFKIPTGTYEIYVDLEEKIVSIYSVEPDNVFILGTVDGNIWASNVGTQMTYDATTGLYSADVIANNSGDGYGYFSFTTALGESWDSIADKRFGAVSEGNYLVDGHLGEEISLTASNGQSFQCLAGYYTITVDYKNMKAVIDAKSFSAPTISPAAGEYADSVAVSLACETAGAEIRYTLDGTEPTAESALYSEPFTLTKTTTVKAIALKNGIASEVTEATYTIRVVPAARLEVILESKSDIIASGDGRYSTGYGDYIFVNDKANGKVVRYDKYGVRSDYATVEDVGTAITSDDAGNILVNRGFSSSSSSTNWTIIEPDGTQHALQLTFPAAVARARVDQAGRVAGDVMSAEGGYLFLTVYGAQKVVSFKIANGVQYGDAVASPDAQYAFDWYTVSQPRYAAVEEIESAAVPSAAVVYRKRGDLNVYGWTEDGSEIADFGKSPKARVCEGFDIFTIDGKTYVVEPNTGTNFASGFSIRELGASGTVIERGDELYAGGSSRYQSFTARVNPDGTATIYRNISGEGVSMYRFYPSVPAPTFSPAAGEYENSVEVSLACETAGAEIRYTLDGSEPTAESALYSEPFTLTETATVKAIALKNGSISEVTEATYAILSVTPPVVADDMVYVLTSDGTMASVSLYAGAKKDISISMKNSSPIYGFQFDLSLPEGVTIAADNQGRPLAALAARAEGYTLATRQMQNGAYRFIGYAMTSDPISGNDGALLDLTLDVSVSAAEDRCLGTISNILLTSEDANTPVSITQPDFDFYVNLYDLMLGDVNGDRRVNVTDVVAIVSYILEDTPAVFMEIAADVNGDGQINVTDVVGTIEIILSDDGGNAPNGLNVVNSYEAMPTANESLTVGEFTDKGFAVNLASAKDYVACQMDITVDNGANITGIALDAARTYGHAVNYTRLASGKYRVVVYSPSLEHFTVGEGALFNVATDRSIGSLKIEDIRFVTADMAETMFDAIDISSADIAKYYSGISVKAIGDKLVVTSDRDILLPLYSTSGRLVRLLDVKAGRNVFVGFHKDVYVVNCTKIMIR